VNRIVAIGLLAGVLGAASGCAEEKKAPPPADPSVPKASDMFDKTTVPKGAKKSGPGGS
jgi:hypothetical protein